MIYAWTVICEALKPNPIYLDIPNDFDLNILNKRCIIVDRSFLLIFKSKDKGAMTFKGRKDETF